MRTTPLHRAGAPRPWPHRQPSLIASIEALTASMNRLTAALAGEAVPADSEAHSPPGIPTSHRQRGGVTAFHGRGHGPQQGDGMARAEGVSVGSASELWNTPWQELSVRELRSLLRDLPIDRSSLPAPIENLRRDELLEALDQLQAMEW